MRTTCQRLSFGEDSVPTEVDYEDDEIRSRLVLARLGAFSSSRADATGSVHGRCESDIDTCE